MTSPSRLYWIHALTPVHVGVGQGAGFIDLPIMREKITNWPLIPGSSIKGVMRDYFTQNEVNQSLMDKGYGFREQSGENAGALVYTDARIVLLPVRSYYGTFAYVTSSLVLQRLKRDIIAAGINENLPDIPDENSVKLGSSESKIVFDKKVYLEELDFPAEADLSAVNWAEYFAMSLFGNDATWAGLFKDRFAVLPDESFNFLCQTGTEVNARVRINEETKTVQGGALWYEESLPAETVMAGVVWCDRVYGGGISPETIMSTFCSNEVKVQIGGKATVGKGRVRCIFSAGRE